MTSTHPARDKRSAAVFLLCLLAFFGSNTCSEVNGLSFKDARKPARPAAKRVAIIGTGIAGLSVAHGLTNSPTLREQYGSCDFDVSLFEARKNLDTKGGAGVQLNGGLVALGMMNASVQRAVIDAGLPLSQIRTRSKPWSTSSSKPFEELLKLDLKEIVENAGGDTSDVLIRDGELLWSAIRRGCLLDTLWKTLPDATRRRVKFSKRLIGISPQPDGSVMCEFSDGVMAGPFDVVLGCDGVRSPCKEYVGTGRISRSSDDASTAAIYSGIRIKYAVDDAWTPDKNEKQSETETFTQYFGDGANALVASYGNGIGRPSSKVAFFVRLDENYVGPFRKKEAVSAEAVEENINWREGPKLEGETMMNDIEGFSIPTMDIDPVVKSADRFGDIGIYFHNPFRLAGWSKKLAGDDGAIVTLVGDAAHSIPPFLGQGANQAIQDSYCVVTKLYEYNSNVATGVDGPGLDKLMKDYERTRWFHNFIILLNSCFLGYLETGGEHGGYAKFRDLFFQTTGFLGIAQRILLSAAVPKV